MQRKASAVWKGGLKDGKGIDFGAGWGAEQYAVFLYDAV